MENNICVSATSVNSSAYIQDKCICDIVLCGLSEVAFNNEVKKISDKYSYDNVSDFSHEITEEVFYYEQESLHIPDCVGLDKSIILNSDGFYTTKEDLISTWIEYVYIKDNISLPKSENCYESDNEKCLCGIKFSYKVRVYQYSFYFEQNKDFNHPKFCCAEYENIKSSKQ